MTRPIAISLSPNTEKDDVILAVKVLLSPWRWYDLKTLRELEKSFAKYLGVKSKFFSVNSGRSAEYVVLKSLGVGKGDEVVVQAFTCVSVPNSIIWLGATPIYADIDDSYNMCVDDLERKITPRTKAVMVQHTFGIPADIKEIKKVVDKYGLILIEDCAHSLGAKLDGKMLGTFGDVAFFSFGRDKIISSVFGGMIVVNRESLSVKIEIELKKIDYPSFMWVFQQLMHPIVFSVLLPFYNLGLGKILLVMFQKINLLSKAIYKEEKSGGMPSAFPKKMSPALSILANHQLRKIKKYNQHRRAVARYYFSSINCDGVSLPQFRGDPVWLRVPIVLPNSQKIFRKAKQRGILLGDWYSGIVTPVKKLGGVGYRLGMCPKAEKKAASTLNLPTYPTLTMYEAQMVTKYINGEI